ncbi:hypothetical protein CMV_025438 [Castanea mollissima]|uniref:Uncharacterized protein n=1 Tax=Castanea mollissima TaxID=60419 RepID=A0A8J4V501_9ROSI|nr:hypothetical protein CMV_025438 [Castanea mollissima]
MFDVKQRQKARQHSFIFQQTPNLRLLGLFDHLRALSSSISSGAGFGTHYYQSFLRGRGLLFANQQLMANEESSRLISRSDETTPWPWFDLPAQTITPEIQKDLRLLKGC